MPEHVKEQWVYAGVRVGSGGKRIYTWANVETPDALRFWNKQIVQASVGSVFQVSVEHVDDGAVSVTTAGSDAPVYLKRFEDKELVQIWAVQDEKAKEFFNLKKVNNEATKIEPLDEMVEKIRKLSYKLNRSERRALLAKISEAIFSL